MGYMTYFGGTINLSEKRFGKIINYMIKKEIEPFSYMGCIVEGKIMDIGEDWKNYDELMEKICFFIAELDKKAEGEIICDGEERDDNWKIVIKNGEVKLLRGTIIYKDEENFCDEEIIKKVDKIINDKELNKKLILESLYE